MEEAPNRQEAKQPYLIRLKSREPIFFAAIAELPAPEREGGGFALITAASEEGMVDIHDRRPVVLRPDVAREWLLPGLLPEHAEDLLRHHDTPVDEFEWFPVGKSVGNVSNHGPDLIKRIDEPLL